MSKKEEQSKAYIKPTILYRNKNLNDNNWELGLDYMDFTGYEVQCAFEAGWDAACSEVGGENYNCGKILNLRRKAYAKGKEDFLDMACKWLENNLARETSIITGGYAHVNFGSAIKKFREYFKEGEQ